ncbi:hypothetical protein DM860_015770 [Cuscuta australis]|uniref:Protein kinase domain-containing protein n=1 Tax=Cuscuta australis TaxID=267555 RepID=A0A328E2F8_9ASTE|nr:hypothetical protein DM860_015770 [Cuscuta australis]
MEKKRPTRYSSSWHDSGASIHPPRDNEVVKMQLMRDERFRVRWLLIAIDHKNIVKLVGFAESDQHFYLVYELVDRRLLGHMIEDNTSLKMTINILIGITSAITYLQDHGSLVHCDICLDNIIVQEDRRRLVGIQATWGKLPPIREIHANIRTVDIAVTFPLGS